MLRSIGSELNPLCNGVGHRFWNYQPAEHRKAARQYLLRNVSARKVIGLLLGPAADKFRPS